MKRAAPPVWPQVVPALPPRAARVRPSSSLALCTESGTGLCSCWQSMAVRFGPRVSRSSPCDPKEAGTPQHASARGALAPTGPCPLVPSSSRQTPTKAVTAASRCSAVSKLGALCLRNVHRHVCLASLLQPSTTFSEQQSVPAAVPVQRHPCMWLPRRTHRCYLPLPTVRHCRPSGISLQPGSRKSSHCQVPLCVERGA